MNSPASLATELMAQLQGAPLQQIAQQLGASPAQTQDAVGAALPLLLGTLGRNAAQPQGAMDLFGALQRDHSGAPDLGDLLGSLLGGGGGGQTDGAAILGHIFGGQQQRAEAGLGQATGLGANAGQLLQMLAPIVMAFLAKRLQSGGMDAGGLGQVLGQERARVQQQGGLGGGLLGSLLDQDGDGEVGLGDLLKMGGSLLGGRR
ncbi:MAG: calcium-binding protein [Acidovorax sp. SCN 68-22]|nr:MAG: calcium-binding protein [Acidovorax sp. SCN 68-22]